MSSSQIGSEFKEAMISMFCKGGISGMSLIYGVDALLDGRHVFGGIALAVGTWSSILAVREVRRTKPPCELSPR
jgi:hypothetical protein